MLYTEVNLQILSWFNAKTFVVTKYLCTESFILVIRLQKSNTDTFSSSENECKFCQICRVANLGTDFQQAPQFHFFFFSEIFTMLF